MKGCDYFVFMLTFSVLSFVKEALNDVTKYVLSNNRIHSRL